MTIINLHSLLDSSLKVKQSYITASAKQKITILVEKVTISRLTKFHVATVYKLLRCLLRLGFFTSEVEFESDDINMTDLFKMTLEYTSTSFPLKVLLSHLAKELIAEDVEIETKSSQIEVIVIEPHKPPIKEIQAVYPPLGITIMVGAYGTIDVGGQLAYIFSLSLKGDTKKACVRYLLPTEVLSGSDLVVPQKPVSDIFSLPDRVKILFNNKSDTCIFVDGVAVMFGKASFLKSVLPESGWFIKLNKRVGKSETILLLESSWELTASQKAYVARNLAH